MDSITFKYFVSNLIEGTIKIKEASVAIADIKEFGIRQQREKRKDFSFKKFSPTSYIILKSGACYNKLAPSIFKTLKEIFEDKCEVSKETVEEYKKTRYGYAERKAVEWTFKVNRVSPALCGGGCTDGCPKDCAGTPVQD